MLLSETKESSIINMSSFVKFMKYPNPNPNHRSSIKKMDIGFILFCDFTHFWIRIRIFLFQDISMVEYGAQFEENRGPWVRESGFSSTKKSPPLGGFWGVCKRITAIDVRNIFDYTIMLSPGSSRLHRAVQLNFDFLNYLFFKGISR